LIPKIIHYCWISGDEFPENIRQYVGTWEKHLPDYEFILWDYDKINAEKKFWEELGGGLWLKQSIETKKYAFAADYIRVFALNRYGGIYLDTDVEIRGSFDAFLNNDLFIGFDYSNDLEPAILGSVPGHPWMNRILENYRNRSFICKDGSYSQSPLPKIFEETSKKLFNYRRNGKFQSADLGITMYPYEYFSPKDIYFNKIRKTSNTVAIHHFDGSWLKKDYKFHLKRIFHQVLYLIGGKQFHDINIGFWREISKSLRFTHHNIFLS
jgi:mannosyltransferase OCH1-like enzyme